MKFNFANKRMIVSTIIAAICLVGSDKMVEASDVDPSPPIAAQVYDGISYGDMTGYTYIRREPRNESDWIGKLDDNNRVEILSSQGSWAKIQSGTVEGYVEKQYLLNTKEAPIKERECITKSGTVSAHALNVRTGPGTAYDITDTVVRDTKLEVIDTADNGWVQINYDGQSCYVSGDYVSIAEVYTYAESKQEELDRIKETEAKKLAEEQAKKQVEKGQEVLNYASQFLGNPYVWGGTDLINGADCSGFVQSVYYNFGVVLPRTSSQQRSAGVAVSYDQIEVGDIVCYEGHVGIYAGNGNIINAIDPYHGIGISPATYNPIITIRRVL